MYDMIKTILSIKLYVLINFKILEHMLYYFELAFFLHPLVKVPINTLLIFYILKKVSYYLKIHVKGLISPSYNQKNVPAELDLKLKQYTSTTVFSTEMQSLGGVVKFEIIPDNYVISQKHAREFVSLPPSLLNATKAQAETNSYSATETQYMPKYIQATKAIGLMFNSKYRKSLVKTDSANFQELIKDYISQCGIKMSLDVIKIENVLDFLIYILSENAFDRVFGKRLGEKAGMKEFISSLIKVKYLNNSSRYNVFNHLKNYNFNAMYIRKIKKLTAIIKTELNDSALRDSFLEEPTTVIQMVKKNSRSLEFHNDISVALTMMRVFECMIVILPSRILNVLVDISDHADRLVTLVQEQKKVIDRYGMDISLKALGRMKYLEAFIHESLILSSPASCMHRKLAKDWTMSNGTTLPANSLVSINLFPNLNPVQSTIRTGRKFCPSRYVEKTHKLGKPGMDNLIWGYGNRMCPFIKYSISHIKIIIAVLLRDYYIYNEADRVKNVHSDYQQISTVIPNSDTIYLKKYNIQNIKLSRIL